MRGPGRWIASAVVLIAAVIVSLGSSSCSSCDSSPPSGCYPPPGATHEQACAICTAGYTGCRDGDWVTIPCGGPIVTPRDGGR